MDTPIANEPPPPPQITILDPAPSYARFLHEHLERNAPCLIGPGLAAHWPAFALWTEAGAPDWAYLRARYGAEVVSVATATGEARLRDVIDLWRAGAGAGAGAGLYVKDWHLARRARARGEAPFYATPALCADDWMNAFWEQAGADDFRFVYAGVAGTFTPLHRDVYASYSWSTNIAGTKVWRLFPPCVSHLLRRHPERTTSEIVHDVRDVDGGVFRGFETARREMLVVEQGPGWTIFVPSGWYHQVENVTDAISINHNWCNITNLPSMYAALCTAASDVESALSDVHELLRTRSGNPEWEQEWAAAVQDVLRKDSGWDWITFWRMIVHNVGQMKDPPLIPDSPWPPTPSTLRPPLAQTRAAVERLLEDFASTRAADVMHISDLSEVLDTLRSLLASE